MRTSVTILGLLLCQAMQAQPFLKAFGSDNVVHPSFAAAPDAFYLAHGSDHELIKTDVDGNVIWSRQLEYNGTPVGIYRIEWINEVLLVSGGHAAQQNFIAALDADGNLLWANAANFGDINLPTRILWADGGGYITVGHREYPTGGGWTFDITLCRWDPDGELLWAKAYGDDVHDFFGWTALSLVGGDILVAGERKDDDSSQPLLARFNSTGELIWMKSLADQAAFFTYTTPTDLAETLDGNYALVATTYNTNFNYDSHVLKFDLAGDVLWGKRMYQVGWTEVGGSVVRDGGEIVVSGHHSLGNANGGHVVRLQEDDGTPVQVKTLPYFRSPSASGWYTGRGKELVSFAPDNYVLAGECAADLVSPSWHGLATFRFNVDPACGAAAPYPFEYANITWVGNAITDIAVATNITEVPVTITSTEITTIASDLCSVLSVAANEDPVTLELHPNPSGERCRLMINERPSAPVQVIDHTGRVVEAPMRWISAKEAEIDLGRIAAGVYTVRVQTRDTWYGARVVRE